MSNDVKRNVFRRNLPFKWMYFKQITPFSHISLNYHLTECPEVEKNTFRIDFWDLNKTFLFYV